MINPLPHSLTPHALLPEGGTLSTFAQTPPPQSSWLSLDTIFWFTVLFIFLLTIFSALLRRLAKDKTLKLFHEYHVAFFSERRQALWGDCLVYSQGIELLFDQAFVTRRKLIKSSAMIYEDEFVPMICLTRSIHGLTEGELRDRAEQIERTFRPGIFRRMRRWFANMLNTMRDAITKTMSLVIGRMSAATGNIAGAAMSSQAGDISALTGNVVSLAANAYEPLLERYIGHPVVVEINLPPPMPGMPPPPPPPGMPPPPPPIPGIVETAEFPGYLVDYSQKFIAVFNVDHTPVETLELSLEPLKPTPAELPELRIISTAQDTIIRCEGKDAFVLRRMKTPEQTWDLGIALIPGTAVFLAALTGPTVLTVERTRQIDLIVPRTRARIRFGSKPVRDANHARKNWMGLAPLQDRRDFITSLRERVQSAGESIRAGLTRPLIERPERDKPDSQKENQP